MTVRIIQWIAGIAGLGALTLGLLFWITHIDFISIHMLFGLIVALALLILGIMAVSTHGMRLLGAASIVYALILPIFGLTQHNLLVGNLHWLIQTAHMLIGLGGLALMGIISGRFLQRKQMTVEATMPPQAVR